jgi:type 1 fimbria pilin
MKYISISNLSAVAALLLTAGSALAAGPTATLQVKGTITPAACTPVLANGGIIDFGATSTSEFTPGRTQVLTKEISLNVTCTAPTKVSFSVMDNREDSFVNQSSVAVMGLGKTTDGKKIGEYYIKLNTAVADDVAADVISSGDQINWKTFVQGTAVVDRLSSGGSDSNITVAAAGTQVPVAFENMSMNLDLLTYLTPEMGSITEVQQLDGNATLNFDYL